MSAASSRAAGFRVPAARVDNVPLPRNLLASPNTRFWRRGSADNKLIGRNSFDYLLVESTGSWGCCHLQSLAWAGGRHCPLPITGVHKPAAPRRASVHSGKIRVGSFRLESGIRILGPWKGFGAMSTEANQGVVGDIAKLMMHRLIVRQIRRDPTLVERAKIAHARQADQFAGWPFVRKWDELLSLPRPNSLQG
jgi:hypothetical protein